MTETVERDTSYGPFRLEITGKLVQNAGFRIGASESLSLFTDLPVLRWETGRDGKPYIPGSSLRGVMRAHLERENGLLGFTGESVLQSLFGHAPKNDDEALSCRGRLRVMDCLPETVPASSTEVRDHVSIDSKTGAALDKAKFDAEHVVIGQAGSFPFHLIYEGELATDDELILLGEAVRALKAGELIIGSRASIGFGRFELKDEEYRVFDRKSPAGLQEFLAFRLDPAALQPASTFVFPPPKPASSPGNRPLRPLHRLQFKLSIACNGPLLVKEAASPNDLISKEAPGTCFLDTADTPANGQPGRHPLIPGSSIRGVLRHRAEKICTAQGLGSGPVLRLFGSKKEQGADTERRGLVQFEDCILTDTKKVDSDHVAVDRITHAAADGAKFDDRALNGPVLNIVIRAQFTDDANDRVAMALLLFLVRDLMTDGSGIAFGSQTSRGYGSIHVASLTELKGSVYGKLADKLCDKTGTVGRLLLADLKLTSEDVFQRLCSALNEDWPPAKQAVPA